MTRQLKPWNLIRTAFLFTLIIYTALGCASGCTPALDKGNGNDKQDILADSADAQSTCEGDPATICGTLPFEVGEGDEATTFVPGQYGICAAQVAAKTVVGECVDGAWVCNFEGFVENDETCDGIDSDCDDIDDVDEIPLADIESCSALLVDGEESLLGVCASLKVTCKEGKHVCDPTTLPDYTEVEGFEEDDLGKWCDNKDNDCDGVVDGFSSVDEDLAEELLEENVSVSEAFDWDDCPGIDEGLLSGVCDGNISGSKNTDFDGALPLMCSLGKLECAAACSDNAYWDVNECELEADVKEAGYEAEETSCDGLDNDCDGEVDDVYDVAASGCPYKGVCAGKVEAVCKDIDPDEDGYQPGWECVFDPSLLLDPNFRYQDLSLCEGEPGCGAESICDSLDNDCDGLVDEGLTWPQECFSQAADGTLDYGCQNAELPQCAQYHPECAESEALTFEDCPIWAAEKVEVDGVDEKVPALAPDGSPLLLGVCAPEDGVSPVRYSCNAVNIDSDEEPDLNMWQCNYELVEDYSETESLNDAQYCDGLDNNCDGVPDGEMKANGTPVYIEANKASPHVPCRTLGACAGNWNAFCNQGGKNPGKWTCTWDSASIEMTDPNNPDCDPAFGNCLWAETKCDGIDNDCDGLVDELLDGINLALDASCSQYMDVGVCATDALNTKCADLGGGNKGFVCDFSGVEFYAPVEENNPDAHPSLCDGRDNDCDGSIDENINFFSPTMHEQYSTGCLYKGVCAAGAKAVCAPSDPVVPGQAKWSCDYALLGPEFSAGTVEIGGQLKEVKCDGLDNDCDGQVDEGLSEDLVQAGNLNPKVLSGCPQLGICSGVMKWNCDVVEGQPTWTCDPSGVGLSYEAVETRCDGIDNDCDGQADEDLSDVGPDGADCKALGVCADGGVTAACINQGGQATWACYYDEVLNYDGLVEATCDGLDNDCDGTTDETLDWEAVNACSTQGVCNSPLLDAVCQNEGGWYCQYALIDEWEAEETLCDQLDNDCDGVVDELACDICEPCNDFSNCKLPFCSAVPKVQGDDIKFCTYGSSYCVYIDPYTGACDFADNNKSACADEKTSVLCGNGVWFDKGTCSGTTPVCWEGECRACVPGQKTCDGNNVKICSSQGNDWEPGPICTNETICIGDGSCVFGTEFKINTQSLSGIQTIDASPKTAARKDGGFAVVYPARDFVGGNQTDVLLRLYTANIQAVGIKETIANQVVSGIQDKPDIDNIPSAEGGFIVVWEDSNAPVETPDGTDIVIQKFSDAGQALGERIAANTTTVGNQTAPSVAAFANGTFIVAWEHDANGQDEPEVLAQAFKADGSKFGTEFQVNTTVPSEQRSPALGRLGATGVLAAWTSQGQIDNLDIFYQRYDKSFSKQGSEIAANTHTTSLQNNPSVAGFGGVKEGAFVIAWETYGYDSSSMGVVMNIFGKTGVAVYPDDVLVNKLVQSGSQRDVGLQVLDDNHFVIAWESQGLPGDTDLEGVAAKIFDANGVELDTDEFLVNQDTVGRQSNPDIVAIPGAGYVVVWFSQPGSQQYNIKGRVFKVQ